MQRAIRSIVHRLNPKNLIFLDTLFNLQRQCMSSPIRATSLYSIDSLIKELGEHPEAKTPVRIMKGQYGPYIKYKSINATIPEEKDPLELTMEEALILIEKRKEYDKSKKKRNKKK